MWNNSIYRISFYPPYKTLNLFDLYKTEIDIEDIKTKKINLFYNS